LLYNWAYQLISIGKEGLRMAEIRIRNTNERISGEQNVREFLENQEVLYEHWDATKLPAQLKEKFILSDEEKAEVLSTFNDEITDLAARRSYKTWDIITLSDATPNLDELLKKFESVHTHTEDEVRAITAGKGIFVIKGTEEVGYFDVELEAGDVISVPERIPHFFTLMDNRQIVAVRLFIETEGWIAHPFEDPAFVK
jgi:1,2-dihydroxy-3-keto-5-methylthiopentene dioxygenase